MERATQGDRISLESPFELHQVPGAGARSILCDWDADLARTALLASFLPFLVFRKCFFNFSSFFPSVDPARQYSVVFLIFPLAVPEVCRRWDVLADEDHIYHLSEQEYFYCKNKWWLHSKKSGSDTLPLKNRSDFKQALSTSSTNNGSWHKVHLLHVGIGKIPGGLLKIQKVTEEASKVLNER